jgi:hypothetical protein
MPAAILPRERVRTAILLAGVGAVAPYVFPFYAAAYTLDRALTSKNASLQRFSAAVEPFPEFLAPLAWALFFFVLYREAGGRLAPGRRRAAAAVSAVLMLAFLAWYEPLVWRSLYRATDVTMQRVYELQRLIAFPLLMLWCAIFAAFAGFAAPRAHRLTAVLAALTLAVTVALGILDSAEIIRHWTLAPRPLTAVRVTITVLDLAGWLLICPFLAEVARGIRQPRPR